MAIDEARAPLCASPLVYHERIFTVKDGGILSCLDLATGKPLKQKRPAATGDYYSSPIAGDGKVYLVNQAGQVTVLDAAANGEVLSTAEFGEDVYATPAIAGGRACILRTVKHLCADSVASGETQWHLRDEGA